MVAPDELRDLSRFAFDEARGGVGGVGAVHRAIATRVFDHVPGGALPVRTIHDAVAGTAYAGVRGAFGVAGRVADLALARRERGDGRALTASQRGSAVVGVVQGLRGDALAAAGSALAPPPAVMHAGRPVDLTDGDALRAAFPVSTARLVVFLPGLMETEHAWRPGSAAADPRTYGERLADDLGCTAVMLRLNSGCAIADNGRALSALLEELVERWPVPVAQIALVGHSMGGLVARAAADAAQREDRAWVTRVRHTVSLGTPHRGAPLEQAVHLAGVALAAVPETRPFAGGLRRRSAGIKDLRHGSLVDEHWGGRDRDALRAAAREEIGLIDGALHCFVAATITRDRRHPFGRLVGDGLVLAGSATGAERVTRLGFDAAPDLHVGGATHRALLRHPAVYAQLRTWLA